MLVLKAAAYDIAPHIDADTRAQLIDSNTHDLTDVVKKLRDSHTPGWLYYYLTEVGNPPNLGSGLAALVDDDTIENVATDYATAEHPTINLATPGASNWMSDDPLAPVRKRYEQKREDIGDAIVTAYSDAFGDDLPLFTTDEFQQWFRDAFLDNLNFLTWAVYEQRAADRGVDDPTATVADWHVRKTRDYDLIDVVATYRTRGEGVEAYLEDYHEQVREKLEPDQSEIGDESDIPLRSPSLPTRDVSSEEIREHIDDSELPF